MKFLLLLSVFLFVACSDSSKKEAATQVVYEEKKGKTLVQEDKKFTLTTTKGEEIELEMLGNSLLSKQLNGKVVLINFWATWCPPCIEEMPMFNELYEKYSDKFEIIGVLYEHNKDKKELAAFLKKHKIKFPVVVSEENFPFAKRIGNVQRIPESFLYSKDGMFIDKFVGVVDEVVLKWNIEQNKDE